MIFTATEGLPERPPRGPAGNLKLRQLPLSHYGIADRCVWRRLWRLRCPECFDLLALHLLLCRAITQAYFMLLGLEPENLKIVLTADDQDRSDARAASRLFLGAVAFRFAFFDL